MQTRKLHADEISVDESLVHRLLVGQFPRWANLPIASVPSPGTVNAMYRLGDDMVVRLPRIHWALDGLDRELRWLPWLAPRLPVTVPMLLAEGIPAEGYPWLWCVYRWLAGETPEPGHLTDPLGLARDIAAFLSALQRIDASKGPPSDQSLAARDAPVRAIANHHQSR